MQALFQAIAGNRDPHLAIQLLLQRSDNPYTLYNCWKRIRTKLVRDERMWNPIYDDHLEKCMSLAYSFDSEGFDYITLRELLISQSRPVYHNFFEDIVKERTTFENAEVAELFLDEDPFIPEFYAFKLPEDIIIEAIRQGKAQRQSKFKRSSRTDMTYQELTQIRLEAEAFIDGGYQHKRNRGGQFIEALLIVSGRRLKEIMETLQLHGQGNTEYSARVSGICKCLATLLTPDNITIEPAEIPLLIPYEKFRVALNAMREAEGIVKTKDDYSRILKRLSRVVWGNNRRLSHADRRGLYGELAFLDQDRNRCYIGHNKRSYIAEALQQVLIPSPLDCYTHYHFE